jgi:hypothetical protein
MSSFLTKEELEWLGVETKEDEHAANWIVLEVLEQMKQKQEQKKDIKKK